MRGTAGLTPAKNTLKQIYPLKGSLGSVATSTPKKQGNNEGVEGVSVTKVKDVPVAAFSRPPPLPPVLGPLLALSLLETWSSRDGDDD